MFAVKLELANRKSGLVLKNNDLQLLENIKGKKISIGYAAAKIVSNLKRKDPFIKHS